jgi:hypothetical protein
VRFERTTWNRAAKNSGRFFMDIYSGNARIGAFDFFFELARDLVSLLNA